MRENTNPCPYCGLGPTVRFGHQRNGRGRFLCKCCGATFSATTQTVMHSRKLEEGEFRAMVNLMVNDTKLKAICDSVGISSRTAYVWRMKIYTAAMEIQESSMLSGKVWIDEKLVPIKSSKEFRFPNGKKPRGASRNQMVIACAVDWNGNRFAIVAGKGHIMSKQCIDSYGRHIAKGSTIIHDGIFSHDRLMSFLGAESIVHKSTTREAHAKLQPVNSFIAEIEHYMNVHTGIDTDYIGLYASWIAFKSSIKGDNIAEKVDELVRTCFQTRAVFRIKDRY